MKRRIVILLTVTMAVIILVGCGAKINLENDIVGSWRTGSSYMIFDDEGWVGMFDTDSHGAQSGEYELNKDTVFLYTDATNPSKVSDKLDSVKVKNGRLTFIYEGKKIELISVSNYETMYALDHLE